MGVTNNAKAAHGRKKKTAKKRTAKSTAKNSGQLNQDFYFACNQGKLETAKELYAQGADIHFRYGTQGFTPLHAAASMENLELIGFLLEKGADAKAASSDGTTVLHQAAWHSTLDIVELLVRHGADVNAVNKEGIPVIHRAITGLRNSSAKLEYLIIHGARTDILNYDGQPITEKIKFHGKEKVLKEALSLKQARMVQLAYLRRRRGLHP